MGWDEQYLLPIEPCGEEQLYHASEAYLMRPRLDDQSIAFYNELNAWLDKVRKDLGT
jgi:hypothetical protein